MAYTPQVFSIIALIATHISSDVSRPTHASVCKASDARLRVAAFDTGVKRSIISNLNRRGVTVELFPCGASAAELLASDPDGIFLVPGPGDPASLGSMVETVRALLGSKPIFGICLGYQLLAQALGLKTFKLPFGHRGANHPVKDLRTGRIAITSQNHGFAVCGPDGEEQITADGPLRLGTDFGDAELTHLNLYDRTIEGLAVPEIHAAGVQYHPEACPGPHDAVELFDDFIAMMENTRGVYATT